MVYKKYIKRGNKLFGPYYYRSVKKGGKVITQYVKNPGDFPQKKPVVNSKKDLTKFLIFPVIFLVLIFSFFILKPAFIGKVILSIENAEVLGETLSGNLKLNLEPNEFIPASTKVLIENNNEKYEFVLSELIKEPKSEREFYVSGTEISGFGEGYGVNDEDLEVSFVLNILSEPKNNEEKKSEEIIAGGETQKENISEITEQNETEIGNISTVEEIIEKTANESEIPLPEETTEEATPNTEITRSAILNFFNNIFLTITGKTSLENNEKIVGKVSKNKQFVYALKDSERAEIIESDKNVNLEIINSTAIVTTEYSGENIEYLINLSELNIPVKDKKFEIKLEYNGTEFYSKNLNLELLNKSVKAQNIFEINLTTDNSTIQFGAVLGEPVKWKKKITSSEQEVVVELPAQAENISIYTLKGTSKIETPITEPVTGNIILEYKSDGKGFFSKIAEFITGRAIEITEKSEKIEVNISENYSRPRSNFSNLPSEFNLAKSLGTEYEIYYTTPAPISFEKNISSGKEIVISSEVHYENILAYTTLPKETNLREIKLYQIADGLKIPVDFIAYNDKNDIIEEPDDLDDDVLAEIEEIVNKKDETTKNKSLIYGEESEDTLNYSVKKIKAKEKDSVSRIEWIVPSLSTQTYELILITKAQHLDSDKNFISDIYDEVKALDGNWSEQINDSEYVRVTFEKNLTNENDITIYPRTVNGTPRIEVYEFNKTELIAEFVNITSNEYNKVYLTNLGKGNSYDDETKILTETGWKYFYELNNEKVATLNQETKELEWQLPTKEHSFDYSGEMYRIILEDESNLLVSPQHKVYSAAEDNLFSKSLGEKTLSFEESRPLSPEKIGYFVASDNATYGASLSCGANCFASGRNFKNSEEGTKDISLIKNSYTSQNSVSDNLVALSILDSLCLTSSNKNSGATNSNCLTKEFIKNTECETPLLIKEDMITLASTTNLSGIFYNESYFLAKEELISSANSSACDCDSLELDTAFLNSINLERFSRNNLLTNKETSIFGNFLNSDSNSCGISTFMNLNKGLDYLNLSDFKLKQITEVYDDLNEENKKENLNSLEKNKGGKNVIPTVRNFSLDYKMYKDNNYLNLSDDSNFAEDATLILTVRNRSEKSGLFSRQPGSTPGRGGPSALSNFKLKPITEIYDLVNNGNEIYFLNSNNEPVKVNLISKENYNGKIYDVDVENDIILVKRNLDKKEKGGMAEPNRLNNFPPQNNILYKPKYLNVNEKLINLSGAVWSGNSETYSQNTFDLKILNGSLEFEHIIDPIILGNANSLNTNTTYENNFTHLNVSNSSIVLYMPFDENYNSTFTFDYTNNSNDGTLVGGTIINKTGCIYGNCYTFDGVNDFINLSNPNSLNISRNITINSWIKFSASQSNKPIVARWGADQSYMVFVDNVAPNKLGFLMRVADVNKAAKSSLTYNDNLWHMVTGIFNGSNALLYIDGALVTIGDATTGPIDSPAQEVVIGSYSNGLGGNFNGTIDEVMIWNTALNSTEVANIYNNQTARFFPTGEMNYTGVNFAGNDTINITLGGCQQNMGTSLRAKVNDGAYVNFDSNCFIKDYNATGNLNSANVTIGFVSDSNRFYTPLVLGNITLEPRDTILPVPVFANPTTNTSNLSQNFIQANVSVTETNLNTINISLFNSTQNIINSSQGTTSPLYINFSGLADGTYYLNATINDIAGNKNYTETRRIGLDRIAPNLTINSPTSGTYETSTILFNATSIDATTLVDSCWYTTNSGVTNRTLTKSGTTNNYNFTQTSISDSTYTARFYCNDSANNVNNTENVAFTVDTSVPVGGGPGPVTAGGGGAPSKPEKKRIFNLGYNMYDQTISLKQVEFDRLQITNNGEITDEYNIEVKTIDNIIYFEKKKIKLEPGESQAPEFKISSPKEPGIYTGKIIVSNGISSREVLVTINVKTEKSLFDITLTIPESLKILLIGENLISKIDLIQMGLKENIDVTLNYLIKDFEGQTYLLESETIAVLDQKSFEKEFFTSELPPGQYVLGTELIHPDGVAVASTHFVVQEKGIKLKKEEILLLFLILALIFISLVIFLSIRRYKKVGKLLKKRKQIK